MAPGANGPARAADPTGERRGSGLFWLAAGATMSVSAHLVATGISRLVGRAMRGTSDLATQAMVMHRQFEAN